MFQAVGLFVMAGRVVKRSRPFATGEDPDLQRQGTGINQTSHSSTKLKGVYFNRRAILKRLVIM